MTAVKNRKNTAACLSHLHTSLFLLTPFLEMELTGCSETLAYIIQTPGNYPEEITCPSMKKE